MPIRAVLFDLDGTLIERSLNGKKTFHRILTMRGIHVSVEDVEKAVSMVKKDLETVFEEQHGKIPIMEFYNIWSFLVLSALGMEDPDGDISREAYERCISLSDIKVFPDTKPALSALRNKDIKIGIISGGYEEEVRKMLEVADLDEKLFDVIVGSDTAGRRKPDPEAFRYTLGRLGIAPEKTIYVGNDPERDYEAAEKVGMKPFLIIRGETTVPKDMRKINNLISLTDYLD